MIHGGYHREKIIIIKIKIKIVGVLCRITPLEKGIHEISAP
jgi:hypothetical protein